MASSCAFDSIAIQCLRNLCFDTCPFTKAPFLLAALGLDVGHHGVVSILEMPREPTAALLFDPVVLMFGAGLREMTTSVIQQKGLPTDQPPYNGGDSLVSQKWG